MKPKQHISSSMTSNIQLFCCLKKKITKVFFKDYSSIFLVYGLHQNVTLVYSQALLIMFLIILLNWHFKALK